MAGLRRGEFVLMPNGHHVWDGQRFIWIEGIPDGLECPSIWPIDERTSGRCPFEAAHEGECIPPQPQSFDVERENEEEAKPPQGKLRRYYDRIWNRPST